MLSFVIIICIYIIILMKKYINHIEGMSSRYNIYYKMLNQWVKNKSQNKRISNFLREHDINTVAIYGIGEIGQRLYDELNQDQLNISYFIDAAGERKTAEGVDVISLKEIPLQEQVDAIIVTPVYDFESIYDNLLNKNVDTVILSLEGIIFKQK